MYCSRGYRTGTHTLFPWACLSWNSLRSLGTFQTVIARRSSRESAQCHHTLLSVRYLSLGYCTFYGAAHHPRNTRCATHKGGNLCPSHINRRDKEIRKQRYLAKIPGFCCGAGIPPLLGSPLGCFCISLSRHFIPPRLSDEHSLVFTTSPNICTHDIVRANLLLCRVCSAVLTCSVSPQAVIAGRGAERPVAATLRTRPGTSPRELQGAGHRRERRGAQHDVTAHIHGWNVSLDVFHPYRDPSTDWHGRRRRNGTSSQY